jgi:hypothetical protein
MGVRRNWSFVATDGLPLRPAMRVGGAPVPAAYNPESSGGWGGDEIGASSPRTSAPRAAWAYPFIRPNTVTLGIMMPLS